MQNIKILSNVFYMDVIMKKLLIKFSLSLQYSPGSVGVFYISDVYGPQFHRWLPDGERDAIFLDTNDPNATLKIWFERCGYVEGNQIIYKENKRDVPKDLLNDWGRLNGGNLFGLLEIDNISNDLVESLSKKSPNCAGQYIALEKRIIKLFYPAVRNFLDILKTYFGQYWLADIEEWDSRIESASSYLNANGFPHWSIDGGKTWEILKSGPLVGRVQTVRAGRNFSAFINEKDWQVIKELAENNHQAPLALLILSKAIMYYDTGNIRFALIYSVIALDLAIDNSFKSLLSDINFEDEINSMTLMSRIAISLSVCDISNVQNHDEIILKFIKAFKNLKMFKKLRVLEGLLSIPEETFQSCKEIVDLRNNCVVHDVRELPDDISEDFIKFLQTFQFLFPNQKLKFPFPNPGNVFYESSD